MNLLSPVELQRMLRVLSQPIHDEGYWIVRAEMERLAPSLAKRVIELEAKLEAAQSAD